MTDLTPREVLEGFIATMQSHGVRAAFEQYAAEDYIQHNPNGGQGREGAIAYLEDEQARGSRVSLKRIISEGNMIALHMHMQFDDGSPDLAIVDIWRVENGRFAEHWDVHQPITKADIAKMF